MNETAPLDARFAAARPKLHAIAYRMLGSRADADDVLQEAWLRWHRADTDTIDVPEAWLVTVTTRLSIDRLRAVQAERAAYPGLWLPEPWVDGVPDGEGGAEGVDERTPESIVEQASDVSVAFLWVLERLTPDERAAFLLREVFDRDYAEIAGLVDKTEAACRQLVHRAGRRIRESRRRFDVPRDAHRQLLGRFMAAAQSGETAAMEALLADGVSFVSDGGGKVSSVPKVLDGAHRIANLYAALERHLPGRVVYRAAQVNGEPGLLRYVDGALESVQAFETDGERIVAIYALRNPDKLPRGWLTLP